MNFPNTSSETFSSSLLSHRRCGRGCGRARPRSSGIKSPNSDQRPERFALRYVERYELCCCAAVSAESNEGTDATGEAKMLITMRKIGEKIQRAKVWILKSKKNELRTSSLEDKMDDSHYCNRSGGGKCKEV